MRIVKGVVAARESVLNRRPVEEQELPASVRESIRRVFGYELDVSGVVDRIFAEVRKNGDAAVRRFNLEIDGVKETCPLEVTQEEIEQALSEVDPELVSAMQAAGSRIRAFHEKQLEHSLKNFREDGIGQIVRPIERVGLYVPGTHVAYPSTVLMTAIPARVAGVENVVMATPAAEDGSVSPLKLVAASISGVDGVYRAGGAQAIAALAYGTESIPAVDKICGPGNVFVTAAKKRVYGDVGIDGIFGPSETVVVADHSADADMVAADLLAGAEHDFFATAVLVTTSLELAESVVARVNAAIGGLARKDVALNSLADRGGIAVVDTLEEALALANEFAPEHLCLHVADPDAAIGLVKNAGGVFAGESSIESIGDYAAGPSHVMPTGGSARFASPLGVHDFLKVTSIVKMRPEVLEAIGPAAALIARAEGLTGHAQSIEARLDGNPS